MTSCIKDKILSLPIFKSNEKTCRLTTFVLSILTAVGMIICVCYFHQSLCRDHIILIASGAILPIILAFIVCKTSPEQIEEELKNKSESTEKLG